MSTIISDPRDFEILNAFIGGRSVSDIAADQGVTPQAIHYILNKPNIKPELLRRLATLSERLLTFKLDAFDGAEGALKKLIKISENGKTEEIQRLASLDVVKISGLMPRKRILVESDNFHGLDQDSKEWIETVIKEVKNMNAP